MSKWNKLISEIKNLSKDLRFNEIKKILESYGYRMDSPSGGSSHRIFRKQGSKSLTIPENSPVKSSICKDG